MSQSKDRQQRASAQALRDALAHYAHITFARDGQTTTARVKWYGYPPNWN
jgi:hypothetical protein